MKLDQQVPTKHTTRLFSKKYKYKIVLRTKGCGWFRSNDLENVKKNLDSQDQDYRGYPWAVKLNNDEKLYVRSLYNVLIKSSDYELRVENPLLSLYTNSESLIESLAKISVESVKYVSFPKPGSEGILEDCKVITKRLDFDYKITIGRTRQNFVTFLEWCEDKPKIRMPKRAKRELGKERSWGGYYFYVKDDKTLTMVKMFVGNCVQSIEKVSKS